MRPGHETNERDQSHGWLGAVVPPPQLAVGIHEALERAILSGDLRPGERINQERVASELGVSRTPVREALQLLSRDGLVTILARRGAFVSSFDERDVAEIYEVRELLEPYAAAAACLSATAAQAQELRRLASEIEHAAGRDLEQAFALNRELHRRLCGPCANSLLLRLLDLVWGQHTALRIYARYARNPAALERSNAEHRAIVEAFAARDAARTESLVREHVVAARRTVVELMDGDLAEAGV